MPRQILLEQTPREFEAQQMGGFFEPQCNSYFQASVRARRNVSRRSAAGLSVPARPQKQRSSDRPGAPRALDSSAPSHPALTLVFFRSTSMKLMYTATAVGIAVWAFTQAWRSSKRQTREAQKEASTRWEGEGGAAPEVQTNQSAAPGSGAIS